MIEFDVTDQEAPALARLLSQVIDPQLEWYCDFRTESETFVVFGEKSSCTSEEMLRPVQRSSHMPGQSASRCPNSTGPSKP